MKFKKIGEITRVTLIEPLLREGRLKSIKHIHHLIRRLMGSLKIFV